MEKKSTNNQITGMAGEFLVAGKLFKRGYQVSLTLGNAKSVDLYVENPATHKQFRVQVKTLRAKNCFDMLKENLGADDIYVFVILNGPDAPEDYFIIRGKTILDDLHAFFGTSYKRTPPSTRPAINYGPLKPFQDRWEIFDKCD